MSRVNLGEWHPSIKGSNMPLTWTPVETPAIFEMCIICGGVGACHINRDHPGFFLFGWCFCLPELAHVVCGGCG